MTTLLINASIRGDDSVSRTLSQKLAQGLQAESGNQLVHRDLRDDLPFVSEASFAAVQTSPDERTSGQQTAAVADALIEELLAADTLVIGVPIYNFGPPASLKAWADLVARAGTTFKYSETGPQGLLKNKKAYIVAVSGGTPIGAEMDFMSTWLRFFLGFLGIDDVVTIAADGIMGQDGDEKIAAAHQQVDDLIRAH